MGRQYRNTTRSYGLVARILHWISVALLGAVLVLAAAAGAAPSAAERLRQAELHVACGLALLLVMALRLAWRAASPDPLAGYTLARWRRILARATQGFLYGAVLTQCAIGCLQAGATWVDSGAVVSAADGATNSAFGIPVAALVEIHRRLSVCIVIAVAVHVAGALVHQLFDAAGAEEPTA
ncbi:MAG: cytochrome b/b6 domain-containing protein [Gammaproteobacteria bacterium]|nr:cytochrome b/b6 domain-containing protein [Gammaproteobacteria bacterium]